MNNLKKLKDKEPLVYKFYENIKLQITDIIKDEVEMIKE